MFWTCDASCRSRFRSADMSDDVGVLVFPQAIATTAVDPSAN
jgi:hypothetical protein